MLDWVLRMLASEEARTLLLAGLLWLYRRFKVNDDRRALLGKLGPEVFEMVEVLGRAKGWKGTEKWTKFIEVISDTLRDAGAPPLSGKEHGELRRMAERRAWLSKPSAPPPLPPQLPAARAEEIRR